MATLKKLKTALNFINKGAKYRPILGNVLVQLDGLYCTDLETYVKIKDNFDLNKGYQQLNTLGLKPSIELEEEIPVRNFSTSFTDRLMVNIKDLEYMLKFASKDKTRPFLNSIAISEERIAACSGHVINKIDIDNPIKYGASRNSYIMPRTSLNVLIKLCKAYKYENVYLELEEEFTNVKTASFDFQMRNIDRDYPKLSTVIPTKFKTTIEIDNFIDFKALKPVFNKRTYGCEIKNDDGYLKFIIGETKQEFIVGEAPIDLDDDFSIGFNCSYLDLASRGQKSFTIKINDAFKPCEVNGSIVMPLKL